MSLGPPAERGSSKQLSCFSLEFLHVRMQRSVTETPAYHRVTYGDKQQFTPRGRC